MYKVFEELLEKNNKTAYRVAEDTGIATATFSEWKKGTYEPKIEKLTILADYFGVPVTVFLDARKNTKSKEET